MAPIRHRMWAFAAAGLLACIAASPVGASTYTFESLSTGLIAGQDNWTSYLGGGTVGTPGGTGNSSTRVYTASGGTGNESFGSRINDGGFSIPTFTGSETAAVLEFDLRLATTGASQATFAVGRDVNNSGSLEAGSVPYELSPVVGVDVIGGVVHFFIATNGGTAFLTYINSPGGFAAGDWIRVRLDMDLTANSGNGSGVLSAQNLTTAGALTPIVGPLSLNLLAGGPAPSLWNTMYAESYGGDDNGGESDNLTVLVPEPATALLLGVGGLLLVRRRIV